MWENLPNGHRVPLLISGDQLLNPASGIIFVSHIRESHAYTLGIFLLALSLAENANNFFSSSDLPGHLPHLLSDKAVTLRMYTHADQESISQAVQIVREAIKKAGQGS